MEIALTDIEGQVNSATQHGPGSETHLLPAKEILFVSFSHFQCPAKPRPESSQSGLASQIRRLWTDGGSPEPKLDPEPV